MEEFSSNLNDEKSRKQIALEDQYEIKAPIEQIHDDNYNLPQFRWRSVVVGSILGTVVVASNMYLGLKSGNTFSSTLLGSIMGFVIMKPLSKVLPSWLGGGEFGVRENATLSSVATACGSMSAGFQSGIPAMYQLDLMPDIDDSWGRLFMWTIAAAFHGMFFGVPLRKYFIIQRQLVFPTPTAAAETIRTLHADPEAGQSAISKGKWIIGGFASMLSFRIITYFVPFLWDLHPLYWIGNAANYKPLIDVTTKWRWHLQLTGAFVGSGMLVGFNNGMSFLAGEFVAYGLLGPLIYYHTEGIVANTPAEGATKIPGPFGFPTDRTDGLNSVQFWLIWPGVAILVTYTFAELAFQYKTIWTGIRDGVFLLWNNIANVLRLPKKDIGIKEDSNDPAPHHEQVPTWMWVIGLMCSTVFSILVLKFYFNISPEHAIVALLLGFVFAFIGTQSAGDIDINPMGSIGKCSQFVFAAFKFENVAQGRTANLMAGVVSMSCAAQTVDMVSDLKTGHVLRASPRSQFYGQFWGSVTGVFAAVVMFWLFAKAYPCVLVTAKDDSYCQFTAPAAATWAAVTKVLVTDKNDSKIPASSGWASLAGGILTVIVVILKHKLAPKYAQWFPNMSAFGMGFVTPVPSQAVATAIGAIISVMWKTYGPSTFENGSVGIASGFIAGEGIGGVILAIFEVSGLSQSKLATGFGCPYGKVSECP
ncbi:OPT superfamily oligopeptide transporter [Conidiobolus coronatus NRRL 28638]|uniref:OPT superfamily oligopeptide transporter n=1 Tax=Conidiobolus coronatus (strain ATCC 28846 / CBS 209.66 / NRRL 28638) TaxID=796925 RepID=A0A137PE91_CONC2|nr:OPT superfamily oligopeptide transporter [Conidiobolus coronatus NRRL 28638]|eukprot:KXN73316.1 OPT superfamily oligopeptide transporter [Conidiobolus coronatus NRRL 28638]